MSPAAIISRSPDHIATEIDSQVVLMSLGSGQTFGLEKSGSRIWALLEQPRSVESIVAELLKVYDTTPAQCLADVASFVARLAEAQLVTIAEPADAK